MNISLIKILVHIIQQGHPSNILKNAKKLIIINDTCWLLHSF